MGEHDNPKGRGKTGAKYASKTRGPGFPKPVNGENEKKQSLTNRPQSRNQSKGEKMNTTKHSGA